MPAGIQKQRTRWGISSHLSYGSDLFPDRHQTMSKYISINYVTKLFHINVENININIILGEISSTVSPDAYKIGAPFINMD